MGGLDVLSQVLVQLESDSRKTLSSAKLAVVVIKTVDACIADNPTFGEVLSKYHIVSKLLALLIHESLDSEEKLGIILTLGHCTEACEENLYDLFKNNGLPLLIQALTEHQNEELNKAATFVLYNCKKITENLSLREYSFDENEAEQLKDISMKEKTIEEYWKKAKEILHRIEQFEAEGNEENIQREKYKDNVSSMNINIQNTLKHLHADSIGEGPKAEDDKSQSRNLQSYKSHGFMSNACANDDQMKTLLKSANPVNACYRKSGQNETLCKASASCNQNLHEETTFGGKKIVSQSRYSLIIVSNFYLFSSYFLCSTVCHTIKHWYIEMITYGLEEPKVGNAGKGVWTGKYGLVYLGPCMLYSGFLVLTHRV